MRKFNVKQLKNTKLLDFGYR